jgi:hypothetical protein
MTLWVLEWSIVQAVAVGNLLHETKSEANLMIIIGLVNIG